MVRYEFEVDLESTGPMALGDLIGRILYRRGARPRSGAYLVVIERLPGEPTTIEVTTDGVTPVTIEVEGG